MTCGLESAYYVVSPLNYNFGLQVEAEVLAKGGVGYVKFWQTTEYQWSVLYRLSKSSTRSSLEWKQACLLRTQSACHMNGFTEYSAV